MVDYTREEYAKVSWGGIVEFVKELDEGKWSERDRMYQLIGYLEAYRETDKVLPFEYETYKDLSA